MSLLKLPLALLVPILLLLDSVEIERSFLPPLRTRFLLFVALKLYLDFYYDLLLSLETFSFSNSKLN